VYLTVGWGAALDRPPPPPPPPSHPSNLSTASCIQ